MSNNKDFPEYSDRAFLLVAESEGNGVGGGDTDDHNQYDGPDKPRTKPSKKKKVK